FGPVSLSLPLRVALPPAGSSSSPDPAPKFRTLLPTVGIRGPLYVSRTVPLLHLTSSTMPSITSLTGWPGAATRCVRSDPTGELSSILLPFSQGEGLFFL